MASDYVGAANRLFVNQAFPGDRYDEERFRWRNKEGAGFWLRPLV
jgi:hypothetical protein